MKLTVDSFPCEKSVESNSREQLYLDQLHTTIYENWQVLRQACYSYGEPHNNRLGLVRANPVASTRQYDPTVRNYSIISDMDGDNCDSFFGDSGYPSDLSDIFTFFSRPDLRLTLTVRENRPIPTSAHDNNPPRQLCTAIYARVFNRGKTAHALEASITCIGLTSGTENLNWIMPNNPLVLERLPKWGHADLAIAYMIPQERIWKMETSETELLPNPHIVSNQTRYQMGLKLSHEPSCLIGWGFTLEIDRFGKPYLSKPERLPKVT